MKVAPRLHLITTASTSELLSPVILLSTGRWSRRPLFPLAPHSAAHQRSSLLASFLSRCEAAPGKPPGPPASAHLEICLSQFPPPLLDTRTPAMQCDDGVSDTLLSHSLPFQLNWGVGASGQLWSRGMVPDGCQMVFRKCVHLSLFFFAVFFFCTPSLTTYLCILKAE